MLLPPELHNTSIFACYLLNDTSCAVHSPRLSLCKIRVAHLLVCCPDLINRCITASRSLRCQNPSSPNVGHSDHKTPCTFSFKPTSASGTPGIVHIPPPEIHDFFDLHRAAITPSTGRLLVSIPGWAPCAGLLSYCHIPTLTLSAPGQQSVFVIIIQKLRLI